MPGFMVRKVIVGMSGGVDSAMAALILKKRGNEIESLKGDPETESYSHVLELKNMTN